MGEEVVFVFEDGEKQIRKDLMYCSAKFSRDLVRDGRIGMVRKNRSDYKDFFLFLQKGEVPNDQIRQKIVFNLLVEWEFHFTHIDSFLWRISEIKIPIKFNQKAYEVNFSRFLIHSPVFRDLYLINPSGGLEFRFNTDEDSFIEFLDVVHGVKYPHEIDKSYEVYKICEFFGCDSLCNLFDVKKIILKDIINGFDLPVFEKYMSENLKKFLNEPEFASLPLPILIRLFQQNTEVFSFSDLIVFFDKYYHLHPTIFPVLFKHIHLKIQSSEEIDEFGQAMSPCLPGIGIIYSNFQKRIEELNQKMKRKEAEDQKRIEELNQQMEKLKNKYIEAKRREELVGIVNEKWKSTKAPDFEENIFEAAAKGKLTSLIYLLANGTNVDEKYQKDKYDEWGGMKNSTPLHFSSIYGHLSVVEYLVNQKADISAKDKDNQTPLHVAAANGHLSVVEYLVNQKADINAKTQKDSTPLHLAASKGHLSVVEYLVNQKADISAKDKDNQNPLHYAALNGHLSVVEYLVNQKADISAKDKFNYTPLHRAAQNGHLSVVEYLVNQKADINAKNNGVEILYLIGLLFIMLLKMVILVLLNI